MTAPEAGASLAGGADRREMSFREIDARTDSASRLKFQRLVERLHALGPAPLAHFLREVKARADIEATLETYASLPADLIRAYGGDCFPPALHEIDGGRR